MALVFNKQMNGLVNKNFYRVACCGFLCSKNKKKSVRWRFRTSNNIVVMNLLSRYCFKLRVYVKILKAQELVTWN